MSSVKIRKMLSLSPAWIFWFPHRLSSFQRYQMDWEWNPHRPLSHAIRAAACIAWTQTPVLRLRPHRSLDSASARRSCWWIPWRGRSGTVPSFGVENVRRKWQWYLDDVMMVKILDTSWYWWFWMQLRTVSSPISLMFTVYSSWAGLQKFWRDKVWHVLAWKDKILVSQPAMVDRSGIKNLTTYLTTRWLKMGDCHLEKISCNHQFQELQIGSGPFHSEVVAVAEATGTLKHAKCWVGWNPILMFSEFVLVFKWFNLRLCWIINVFKSLNPHVYWCSPKIFV